MLKCDFFFLRDGTHLVEYKAGESDLPLDVVVAAKHKGIWEEAEKPAEKPAEKRATKARAPSENK
jgi:hypothetical protein